MTMLGTIPSRKKCWDFFCRLRKGKVLRKQHAIASVQKNLHLLKSPAAALHESMKAKVKIEAPESDQEAEEALMELNWIVVCW